MNSRVLCAREQRPTNSKEQNYEKKHSKHDDDATQT